MAQHLDFSEFTFGFALTENFSRSKSLRGVPVFPSLKEEGQKTGGYDVALDDGKGLPLLLQFKVPQVVTRRSALMPTGFSPPYYRVHLRCRVNDEGFSQHSVLLEQEKRGFEVYYVAPRFHKRSTLDSLFVNGQVVDYSAFFTPIDVGNLTDEAHHVAYSSVSNVGWLRSEASRMPHPLTAEAFFSNLKARFTKSTKDTFRFDVLVESMAAAIEHGLVKARAKAEAEAEYQGRSKSARVRRLMRVVDTRLGALREFMDKIHQERSPRPRWTPKSGH